MNSSSLVCLLYSLIAFFATFTFGTMYSGVNLAGAEFDSGAQYPSHATIDYFFQKNMNTIRYPFKWERLQPTLSGNFDSNELNHLDDIVTYITNTKGGYIILDPHNYARYNGQIIGASSVTTAQFSDLWSRLANRYKSNSKVIFGLMNEPNTMQTETWVTSANAAIAAIRATGAGNLILVPGNAWTGAHSWTQNWYGTANSVALLNIVDPGNNYAIEAHQYFDSDYSGTQVECQSPSIVSQVLSTFTEWCRSNGKKAFLGEFGGGQTSNCYGCITNAMEYMKNNADVWMGWTWWAAGDGWGGNYIYLLQPSGTVGNYVDRPQMAYLTPYMTSQSTTAKQVTTAQRTTSQQTTGVMFTTGMMTTTYQSNTYAINCGGDSLLINGKNFQADAYFTGGTTYSYTDAVNGATSGEQALYSSERYASNDGDTVAYTLPITSPASVDVVLKFIEHYSVISEGGRIFDVEIEGTIVKANFDIFKSAGGLHIAYDLRFPAVQVSDGNLNIRLISKVQRSKINAIVVTPSSIRTTSQAQQSTTGPQTTAQRTTAQAQQSTTGPQTTNYDPPVC